MGTAFSRLALATSENSGRFGYRQLSVLEPLEQLAHHRMTGAERDDRGGQVRHLLERPASLGAQSAELLPGAVAEILAVSRRFSLR